MSYKLGTAAERGPYGYPGLLLQPHPSLLLQPHTCREHLSSLLVLAFRVVHQA